MSRKFYSRRSLAAIMLVLYTIAIAKEVSARAADSNSSDVDTAPVAVRAGTDDIEALVAEAMRQSPLVAAARSHWRALEKAPIQVSTLPDPEIALQHFTVGSPQPFSGYETSDFYYTGFGATQEIPGPGKLSLRAKQAHKDADYARAAFEAAQRSVAEKVRESCFNLFYLAKTSAVLRENRALLQRIERIVEEGYRVGGGIQQDVTKAQLHMTALLREIEMNRFQIDQQQAELKAILGREIDSHEIRIGDLKPSRFDLDAPRIRSLVAAESPELRMAIAMSARSSDSLELARRDYWPDFSLGYMYQKAGPGLRDYYMLSVGAKVPLYFWRKQAPAVEQAALEKQAATDQVRAARLEADSGVERQIVAIRTADRIVALYRDGLIPQSTATRAAAFSAYSAGKVDFQTLLSAVIDVHSLTQEYYRAIADHETAIAKLKQIIGEQS
ncbi:MAG: TolC family protein [Candidatus Binatus sp.]|uniref:TolC family protein n=1 Tax=Candidatus Binatus sp. TaxID=2811406 RepID=UPI00271F79B4|nr:TolC family protein [Candidatus Binatus sp.]MDO8433390.1 TolC family protein [Candidatus Binatus sp.]